MKKLNLLLLCLTAGCVVTFAQEVDSLALRYAGEIKAEDLKEHLYIIASDEYEGRETGKKGQKMAAEYIANHFSSLGVPPSVNGGYFQEFPLKSEKVDEANLKFGDLSFSFIEDFYFFPGFQLDYLVADAIFVGYGIESESYSDYDGMDVKNKVVLVMGGEPVDDNGLSLVTGEEGLSEWSGDWRLKRDLAAQKGAAAVITLTEEYDRYIGRIKYWLEEPGMRLVREESEEKEGVLPTFFASPEMFDAILKEGKGLSRTKAEKRALKGKSWKKKSLKNGVKLRVKRTNERFTSENVLCYIPGSEPEYAEQLLVITAHYDHIGKQGDDINNGADDDGSGTVAVLELAQAFKKAVDEGNGPKRSLLLMTVSGEEKGLLGSEWYSTHPIYPLENTIANLNIDMIGRKDAAHEDNERYIYLIGSDMLSDELHEISEQANATYTKLELDYTYNDPNDPNRYYYRSDHYNFAKNGIPVIFYFSGVHEDYHKPGDTAEKILYPKMEEVTKLVFFTAWDLLNRDQAPRLNNSDGQ